MNFEHCSPCRSNRQHAASLHQSKVRSSVQSVFVVLHAHDGYSKMVAFCVGTVFPRRNSQADLLSLAALWDRYSSRAAYSIAQRQFLGEAPDMHGPMFSECSELPRSLAQPPHVVEIPHCCHSLRRFIASTAPTVSRNFRTTCCYSALITGSPSDLQKNLHIPLCPKSSAVAFTAYSSGPLRGRTFVATKRSPWNL